MLGLGVDTGGTYTDAVIVDYETGKVLSKAKALTTRQDLSLGIDRAIAQLHFDPVSLGLAVISTTLATNSIVEGKGANVCLLAIGYDPYILYEYGLGQDFPVKEVRFIEGRHDLSGVEVVPLDTEAVAQTVWELRDKVDAFAVSSYLSVRNPDHELRARERIREYCSLPVVCGHDLSSELNSIRRAVTAAFNARLIPIIDELIVSIKAVLARREIRAPLMMVKGDGHLISETLARDVPIETILSGPAASIIGAKHMAGVANGLVIDIGGTTTDIASLTDGKPTITAKGAVVDKWRSAIRAVDIRTSGLGGDSYIHLGQGHQIEIGPRRVIPLSMAAMDYPEIVPELRHIAGNGTDLMRVQPSDFLIRMREPSRVDLTDKEAVLLEMLDRPQSLFATVEAMNLYHPMFIPSERLEELGVIARIGLTPSDILHVEGTYTPWSVEAARLGVDICARKARMQVAQFTQATKDWITRKLFVEILSKVLGDGKADTRLLQCDTCAELIDYALFDGKGEFDCTMTIGKPIIGIGAPVQAYLPQVAAKLQTPLHIPEHAEVANAIGAIMGTVIETVEVLVKPIYTTAGIKGYALHTPETRLEFDDLAEAAAQGMTIAKQWAKARALDAGAEKVEVGVDRKDHHGQTAEGFDGAVYLETRIVATAIGRPHLADEADYISPS